MVDEFEDRQMSIVFEDAKDNADVVDENDIVPLRGMTVGRDCKGLEAST